MALAGELENPKSRDGATGLWLLQMGKVHLAGNPAFSLRSQSQVGMRPAENWTAKRSERLLSQISRYLLMSWMLPGLGCGNPRLLLLPSGVLMPQGALQLQTCAPKIPPPASDSGPRGRHVSPLPLSHPLYRCIAEQNPHLFLRELFSLYSAKCKTHTKKKCSPFDKL